MQSTHFKQKSHWKQNKISQSHVDKVQGVYTEKSKSNGWGILIGRLLVKVVKGVKHRKINCWDIKEVLREFLRNTWTENRLEFLKFWDMMSQRAILN